MDECTEHYTDELRIPFTFPQVKPMYAIYKRRVPKKPLKREERQFEHQAKIETPDDDSLSANSLSGDLAPYQNIQSCADPRKVRKDTNVNDRFALSEHRKGNLDFITPFPLSHRTPFSAKDLVKRVTKSCITSGHKTNEENGFQIMKDSKHTIDKISKVNITTNNGRQGEMFGDNGDKGNNDGRILKDILNYDKNINAKKPVETVKLIQTPKLTNADKGVLVMPSITHQKETGLPDPSKVTNKTTPIKSSRSCLKVQYRRENAELPEKPKYQQALFRENEDHKPNIVECKPRVANKVKPADLCVNNVQYSVLYKLGQGGSSQVYQVLEHEALVPLAVKCVNLVDADECTAKGYLKEIEILLKLQDSNRVIKLLDHEYLKQQQILYIVMEKGEIDLSTLLKQMAKSGDVTIEMITYYWTEMLRAVREIHSLGIVHADLKPANFLLVNGRLKLIDFGIASAIQADATSVLKDSMHGTCNYMSPEAIQAPGDSSKTKVGYKSDVWSLGCILYNLLYRKTPFQHITNDLRKLHEIANPKHIIEFPPVEKCRPQLMNALKHCLKYDAKKRPTVAELLAVDY